MNRRTERNMNRKGRMVVDESGFTLVELLTVVVISFILITGMAAIVISSMGMFTTNKDLESVKSAGTQAMSSLVRMIRSALNVDDESGMNQLVVWADIDGDDEATASNYQEAEKIRIYSEGNRLRMTVTETDGASTDSVLASYCTDLRFYYFLKGQKPASGDPYNPTGHFNTEKGALNSQVGMIRVVANFSRGEISRSYYQDIYLRVNNRE